jgi:hypothetical protein
METGFACPETGSNAAAVVSAGESEKRARAIFAVAGAQLIARSRSDIALYDSLTAIAQPVSCLRERRNPPWPMCARWLNPSEGQRRYGQWLTK